MNSGRSIEELHEIWNREAGEKTTCSDCGVVYTSRGMKFYHKTHCPARRHNATRGHPREPESSSAMPGETNQGSSSASPEINVPVTGDNNTVTNNVTVTVNHVTNITNVVVNPFGEEDIGYLTADEEQFREFVFSRILAKQERGIIEFVRLKYFHPDHPENHTVRILHLSQSDEANAGNTVQVWDGRKWKTREASSVFDDMMFQVNENTRFAVEDGIKKERNVEKVKQRRKILDAVMTGCGTWLDIEFGEVEPEGCCLYDKRRGRFFSGAAYEESRLKDAEKAAEFFGDLRREIITFQNRIR